MTKGNDGSLYSGVSSISFNRPDKRSEKTIERDRLRTKLEPAAEIVMKEIDAIIEGLKVPDPAKIMKYSEDGLPGTLEIYMSSRVVALDEIKSLKTRLNNLLRDNKGAK